MGTAIQLNIPLRNMPGSLAALSDQLRAAEVNINAISSTEGTDKSLVHLIVDDPDTAKLTLIPQYKVTSTPVLSFRMKNKPGAIAVIARACAAAQINIRNIYATASGREATVYVVVDDIHKAQELLKTWEKSFGRILAS
ncbi:MAG: ACT domain-containing protein [Patescibacteria group bacterium]